MRLSRCLATLAAFALAVGSSAGADWLHWRGPEQNGHSKEALPETFDLAKVGEGNLIWKEPVGGRSSPIVMGNKLFVINGYGSGVDEGERVMCLDGDTGKPVWETKFGVFHTDIVSSRLGWTSLAADPATGTVFAHTTAGFLACLDAKTGKVLWQRQLTEEFGRVTGYGGRIASPIFDSGLVILGIVNGSWGDQARGGNRFVAFDGKTGEVVWWQEVTSLTRPLKGTYYSNPVIAVVNGQRILVSGAADGGVHGLKVRTGEIVFSHGIAANVVNPSPVVDGNLVYISHGEENTEGSPIGRVVCLDASQVDEKTKKPKVVWDTFRKKYAANKNAQLSKRFGLASPALADGILYVPDDGGELCAFDAKTGEFLWKWQYGSVARGAPLVAGGKLYIFDVTAKLSVLTKLTREAPAAEDVEVHRFKARSGVGFPETNATPIAVNGRLYFQTREDTYCVGDPAAKSTEAKYKPLAEETPFDAKAEPASIRIFPADVTSKADAVSKFAVKFLDKNGRELPAPAGAAVEWSLPLPPKAPTGAQPPALGGELKGAGVTAEHTAAKVPPAQQGYVDAKFGSLSARARVRVAPNIPFKPNFANIPVGAAPGGWVNTQGKYVIVEQGGKKLLSKVNNDARPPLARANAYMSVTTAGNYTVQADMMGKEVGSAFPDMGLVANRYLLVLDGKTDPDKNQRQLRIVTWEARNRINTSVNFPWQSGAWYTVKFTVEVDPTGKTAMIRGKVWEQGKPEPEKWMIEFKDTTPNKEGAAALYGYISNADAETPGSEIYYDNVSVVPNGVAPAK